MQHKEDNQYNFVEQQQKMNTLNPQDSRIKDSTQSTEEAFSSAGCKLAIFPAYKR